MNVWTNLMAAVTADRDALAATFQWFCEKAAGMAPVSFWLFPRIAAGLIVTVIASSLIFKNSQRNRDPGSVQALIWVATVVIFIIFAQIPLAQIPIYDPNQRGFVLAASALAMVVLPFRLAGLLFRQEGRRRICATFIYSAIALLLLIQAL